jgi:AAA15 family ATPase/GTPase
MIVLDGLDECTVTDDRKQLLKFLSGLKSNLNVKLIVTSRRENDILEYLGVFPSISIAARSTDVKLYVAAEVELRVQSKVRNYKIELHDPGLREEIIDALVDKGNGMYVHHLFTGARDFNGLMLL